MSEEPTHSWSDEFRTLGLEAVRREIAVGRWPQDKLSAAKRWLQLQDIRQWQKRTPVTAARTSGWFRASARYLFGAFALLYAAAKLFRILRFGS